MQLTTGALIRTLKQSGVSHLVWLPSAGSGPLYQSLRDDPELLFVCFIDICGVVFALDWLGIDDIIASPMNVGGGSVEIAHGTFPVPAPATVLLLKGVPIYSAGPQVELTTPTGALLVSDYAKDYGPAPAMTIDRDCQRK